MERLITSDQLVESYPDVCEKLSTLEVLEHAHQASHIFINKILGDSLSAYIFAYPGFYQDLHDLGNAFLDSISTSKDGGLVQDLDLVMVNHLTRNIIREAVANPYRVGQFIDYQERIRSIKTATPAEIDEEVDSLEDRYSEQYAKTDEYEVSSILATVADDEVLEELEDYFDDDFLLDPELNDRFEAEAEERERLRLVRHMRKQRGIFKTARLALGQTLARRPFETQEEILELLAGELEDIDSAVVAKINSQKLDPSDPIQKQVKTISTTDLKENFSYLTGEVPEVIAEEEVVASEPIKHDPEEITKKPGVDGVVHEGYGTINIQFGGKQL